MNATEELRRLLDERGVEYEETNESVTRVYLDDRVITYYEAIGGISAEVIYPKPVLNGTEWLTPEQAIAATLGSEREKALEELVQDMWFWGYEGHMDSESQDWQMKHIGGVLDRMKELGIEVIDE